jgi:hypothetical protein
MQAVLEGCEEEVGLGSDGDVDGGVWQELVGKGCQVS